MSKQKKKKTTTTTKSVSKKKKKKSGFKWPVFSQTAAYIVLGLTLLFVLFVRINLLDIPIERDEGGFAYIGKMMFEGKLLYTDLHDIKLPGLYITYGLIVKLFGFTPTGVHLGLLLFNVATILLLFFFIREIFDHLTAAITAATFAILSLSPNVLGFAGHATQLLLLPGFAGMWLLIKGLKQEKKMWLFLAGLLFGYAFTIKQQSLYFMLLGGIYLLFDRYGEKPMNWKKVIPEMSLLIAGSVLPYLLVVIYMAIQGRFSDLWFWTFEYPKAEGAGKTMDQSLFFLKFMSGIVLKGQTWLWILAGLGMITTFFSDLNRTQKFLAISLPFFMFGGVATGFHFYPHYFVMMLPAVALLTGLLIRNVNQLLAKKNLSILAVVPVLLFFFSWTEIIQNRPNYFFNPDNEQIIKRSYSGNPFLEAKVIGEYIQSISQPEDKIVVFGSEPEFLMYANREAVGGHLFIYPLTDGRYYSEKLQDEMMARIQKEKPKYAVFASYGPSWLAKNSQFHEKMMTELRTNYLPTPVALADSSEPEPVYRLGDEVLNFKPGNEKILWVYQRRE